MITTFSSHKASIGSGNTWPLSHKNPKLKTFNPKNPRPYSHTADTHLSPAQLFEHLAEDLWGEGKTVPAFEAEDSMFHTKSTQWQKWIVGPHFGEAQASVVGVCWCILVPLMNLEGAGKLVGAGMFLRLVRCICSLICVGKSWLTICILNGLEIRSPS